MRQSEDQRLVTIRPKSKIQMEMTGLGKTHTLLQTSLRDVAVTIDEPLERYGTKMGLTPIENWILKAS